MSAARFWLRASLLVMLSCLAVPAAASSPVSRRLVSVKDSPGYRPPADADSAAERLGRRPDAPRVSKPFTGDARSLEQLATAVLGAFHANTQDSLMALCVREDEFRDILWREFPQSRPATGLTWQDAWPVLWGRMNGGTLAMTREYGGHVYTLVRVERREVMPYRNFRLHNGITIVARDDEGREVRVTTIRSIAERKGRFKLYSLFD